MKTIIAVPVFNEEKRVIKVINKILDYSQKTILIVNDGSTDNTLNLLNDNFAKNKRVVVLNHKKNKGKGSTMKTAARYAWKNAYEAIIFIDGDGQHNPKFLSIFEEKLKLYELVFGFRELDKDVPLVRKWGNFIAKKLVSLIFKIKRKDLLCGFFGFRKSVYNQIKWGSKRYGVETEIATKVGKNKLDFYEIKVNTTYIDKYKGVNLFDAFKLLLKIPWWYMRK